MKHTKQEGIYMAKRYVDFHLHTTNSDGKYSLEEMLCAAQQEGLSAIAITDHNGFTLEKPIKYGDLEVFPGAEFSNTYHYNKNKKIETHIVGLFFRGVDMSLNSIFEDIDKVPYVEAIVRKMNSIQIPITMEEVVEHHARTSIFDSSVHKRKIGRHDVAEVLVEKGYAKNVTEAMDNLVGNCSPHRINTLDYVQYIDMEECVLRICNADKPGLPILAHPYYYNLDKKEMEEMVAYYRGITDKPLGMEVYYGRYSDEQVAYLEYLAEKYHLLPSAASDKHREEHPFKKGEYVLLEHMKQAMNIN